MQTELPTKIYEPQPKDAERIAQLSQSDAPVKVYTPSGKSENC